MALRITLKDNIVAFESLQVHHKKPVEVIFHGLFL